MSEASQAGPAAEVMAAVDRETDEELHEPEGPDVPLTDHAPGKDQTGPEERGTGGSG
jgi:hypothetical protein